jgi:acetyl-CoA carboxylase biotin carboxylase subunit
MLKRVLIANRGEIAVRVLRSCRELGISPIAICSAADRRSLHVRLADQVVEIGPAPASESYLVIDRIIEAARCTGAEAIHPGYGFLAENATFARACEEAGIVFIGPPASAIEAMGDKILARERMRAAQVPVVPGSHGDGDGFPEAQAALAAARRMGWPIIIKAAAGGGGKGMRIVADEDRFAASFEAARREAAAAFGNGAVYLERFVSNPRHVEVQVMADSHGNVVHFFERDCSIQRRHQKVIEETPCPVLADETRRRMGEVAVRAATSVAYRGAGTVEFLYDADSGDFYFLEMNTRLQVEHPITELCAGVDLVRWQLLVANGEPLPWTQEDIVARGAAIECRIYAEDPVTFLPSPGRITQLCVPQGPGVRDDSGVYPGADVPPHYDPLISKLCVWAETREAAIARMARALAEYEVVGIGNNLAFHRRVMQEADFQRGSYNTGYIAAHEAELAVDTEPDLISVAAAAIHLHRSAVHQAEPTQAPIGTSHWRRAFDPA